MKAFSDLLVYIIFAVGVAAMLLIYFITKFGRFL